MERHPTDLVSLIPGVLFTGLGATLLLFDVRFAALDGSWVWSVVLILAGIAALATARRPAVPEPHEADPVTAGAGDGDTEAPERST